MANSKRGEGQTRVAVADWMVRLRAALFEAVSEDDIREIAEGLVRRAKEGDIQATRMLFSYILGGTAVNVKNAVIMQGQPLAPLPTAPTDTPPNSPARIHAMTARASRGQELFDERDRKHG